MADSPYPLPYTILAKSVGEGGAPESLVEHTRWCLEVAARVADGLPVDEGEKKLPQALLRLALVLHDIGKAASGFQRMLRGEAPTWNGLRHEVLSALLASSIPGIPQSVILAILTHHRTLPSDGIAVEYGQLPREQILTEGEPAASVKRMISEFEENHRDWDGCWRELRALAPDVGDLPTDMMPRPLALDWRWLERGVSRASSQARTFPVEQRTLAARLRGMVVTCDHLASAHVVPSPPLDLRTLVVSPARPRGFQEQAARTIGNMILRAPTGSGKTEAALMWAQANHAQGARVYYALPHTASIDAMHTRLERHSSSCPAECRRHFPVGVLHSRAVESLYGLMEGEGDLSSCLRRQGIAKQMSTLAREMGFSFRVTTPHQLLRQALRGKGWELMLSEFPSALLVFDEVHAYEPRMLGLILATVRLVQRWGARVAFVSATLPRFLEKLIRGVLPDLGPAVEPRAEDERDREVLTRLRHRVAIRKGTAADLRGLGVENRAATLIVCNHVRTAQEVFRGMCDPTHDMLLHGRFNRRDRVMKEERLTTEGAVLPRILVATQVVEVSLNIDFHALITEPAPIDALVQRMGRVNRAGRRPPADVLVLEEQVSAHRLYGAKLVTDSVSAIASRCDRPLSEADLVALADQVYGNGYDGEDTAEFQAGLNHKGLVDFDRYVVAGAHEDWVGEVMEKTDGTEDVLPQSLQDEYRRLLVDGLWIEAKSLLVPVRRAVLQHKPHLVVDHEGDVPVILAPYDSQAGLQLP